MAKYVIVGGVAGGAVGYEGVDKRIDVIAAFLSMGASIEALAKFEHAYAPPFASAKDPVNYAGFVAENIRAGLTAQVRWSDVSRLKAEGALSWTCAPPMSSPWGMSRVRPTSPTRCCGPGWRKFPGTASSSCTAGSASAATWPSASSARTAGSSWPTSRGDGRPTRPQLPFRQTRTSSVRGRRGSGRRSPSRWHTPRVRACRRPLPRAPRRRSSSTPAACSAPGPSCA